MSETMINETGAISNVCRIGGRWFVERRPESAAAYRRRQGGRQAVTKAQAEHVIAAARAAGLAIRPHRWGATLTIRFEAP